MEKEMAVEAQEVNPERVRADQPAPILLVEDESDFASFVEETIRDSRDVYALCRAESGEEAIAYLSGEGKFADRSRYPFPFLILLDLKMPGTGGFGVLRWLAQHPEIKHKVTLAILSSSQSSKDIDVVYELGAHFFWSKTEGATLRQKVRLLKESWLRMN